MSKTLASESSEESSMLIPDLEIAWRHERSPILVGGPLGQANQHCPFDGSPLL